MTQRVCLRFPEPSIANRKRPTGDSFGRAGGIRTHDLLNPIQAATICNSFAEKELQISLPFQLYQIGRFY
jgi:hypothetical protein